MSKWLPAPMHFFFFLNLRNEKKGLIWPMYKGKKLIIIWSNSP